MSRRLVMALIAACALISLSASGARSFVREVEVPVANVEMSFRQSVSPRRLPGVGSTPIALNLNGRIRTIDGSRPPAVKEFVLDLDRHIAVDVRGLPVCDRPEREIRKAGLALGCKDAIVGRGRVGLQIQFPGQPPAPAASELVVVNGDHRGEGEITLYAMAFITRPITSAFTMEIAITKRQGRGRAVVKVPEFANGAGSLTYLSLRMRKRFPRNGTAVDFLSGRCPTGTIQSGARASFSDGTVLRQDSFQKCGPKVRRPSG